MLQVEKSIPQDHCLACQTVTLKQIFLSTPHTYERFLYSYIHWLYLQDKMVDGISDGVAKTTVNDKAKEAPPVAQRRTKEQKKTMTDAEINEGLSMSCFMLISMFFPPVWGQGDTSGAY